MKIFTAIFLVFCAATSFAQQKQINRNVDSLWTISVEAYRIKDFKKAQTAARQAFDLSKSNGYKDGEIISSFYEKMAMQSDNPMMYDVNEIMGFITALQEMGRKKELARLYNFLAKIYGYYGNVGLQIKHSLEALKLFEEIGSISGIASTRSNLSLMYYDQNDCVAAMENIKVAIALEADTADAYSTSSSYNTLAIIFEKTGPIDSVIYYHKIALAKARESKVPTAIGLSLSNLGNNYAMKGLYALAEPTLLEALAIREKLGKKASLAYTHIRLSNLYLNTGKMAKAKYYGDLALANALQSSELKVKRMAYSKLMEIAEKEGNVSDELSYLKKVTLLKDSILNESNTKELTQKMLTYDFEKKLLLDSIKNENEKFEAELVYSKNLETERSRNILFLVIGLSFLILAIALYWRSKYQARELVQAQKIEVAFTDLKLSHHQLQTTQAQLIQTEKMASLGELTAGIAHEIQNPLNFVNNFSELNKDLLIELKDEINKGNLGEVAAIADDLISNEEKINHHGKRADAIVKGMLAHSKSGSGKKEHTNLNALTEEYLRLAYAGMQAKDKSFSATYKFEPNPNLPKMEVVPQDIGRVLLNLFNNAFYAVQESSKKAEPGYTPEVVVSTGIDGNLVKLAVKDNGGGIPENIKDKIFQPFFTTKPTGQGTGLGLSLSYDIVKAHGGELKVETKEGEGSEFIIELPTI